MTFPLKSVHFEPSWFNHDSYPKIEVCIYIVYIFIHIYIPFNFAKIDQKTIYIYIYMNVYLYKCTCDPFQDEKPVADTNAAEA